MKGVSGYYGRMKNRIGSLSGKRPALIFTEMTIGMFMSVHCRVAWLVLGYHHGSCHCRSSSAHLRSVLPKVIYFGLLDAPSGVATSTKRFGCSYSGRMMHGFEPFQSRCSAKIFNHLRSNCCVRPIPGTGSLWVIQVRNWISSVPRPNLDVSMNSEFSRDRHMFFGLWLSPLQSTCPSV